MSEILLHPNPRPCCFKIVHQLPGRPSLAGRDNALAATRWRWQVSVEVKIASRAPAITNCNSAGRHLTVASAIHLLQPSPTARHRARNALPVWRVIGPHPLGKERRVCDSLPETGSEEYLDEWTWCQLKRREYHHIGSSRPRRTCRDH